MNKVELVGNLTRDPELRETNNGTSVARFTVAVNRNYKAADGSRQTDFISCIAWRRQAEFVSKYFTKGQKIGIIGSIRTSQYDDQNGQRRYVTEVECDEIEFVTSKADNPAANGTAHGDDRIGQTQPPADPQPSAARGQAYRAEDPDFVPLSKEDLEDLPF